MNYKEACDRIKEAHRFGSKPGLDNIVRLCALLGNPQDNLKFVHVAGTNGKGSTCVMIASILKAAGYNTGLYLSPHIKDYRDSFYINGSIISESDFAEIVSVVYAQSRLMEDEGLFATEFEILTACVFLWFSRKRCDVVVLETGMGGRLDATNVIKTPLVSVLTAISLDHTRFLGDTIEDITKEKCGIIKPGGTTVCYPVQEEVSWHVIKKAAAEKDNVLVVPDIKVLHIMSAGLDGVWFSYNGLKAHVALGGNHQALNAVTAVETVRVLQRDYGFKLSGDDIRDGLLKAYLPARQEVIRQSPLILLDGAHNLQGIRALADTLSSMEKQPVAVIMGMLADKQYKECIALMAAQCDRFIAVRPDNPRALDAETVGDIAQAHCDNVMAYDDMQKAVDDAIGFCGRDGAVIICGSLYMTHHMRNAVLKVFK